MTFRDYQIHAHGYFLRADRQNEGLRRLYVLQYNSVVKKGRELKSVDAIRMQWPLLTDPKLSDILSKEDIQERLARGRALTASQNKKIRENVNN